ncbi:MAG: hypothetical protein RLZZ227_1106 [Pseudomonadota bacterium]|jgi:hypothetical protein
MKRQGHVYLLSCGEHVKIGKAERPWRRLEELRRRSAPVRPVMLYCTDLLPEPTLVESRAHQLLADRRLDGEWFSIDPDEAQAAIKQAVRDVRGGWKFPSLSVRRGRASHRAALECAVQTPPKDWQARWRA